MINAYIVLIVFVLSGVSLGQTVPSGAPAEQATADKGTVERIADRRETPRGTVFGFLDASREGDYRRASAFLNVHRASPRRAEPEVLATQLKAVLDRRLTEDPLLLSSAPEGDLTDGLEPQFEQFGTVQLGQRRVDLLLERVTGPENVPIWLIASQTVALVPALYADLGQSSFEQRLPAWLRGRGPFDTAVWQWLALALLTLIAIAWGHLLAKLVVRSLRPIVRRTQSELDDTLIESMRQPMQLLIALGAYRAGIVWIAPSVLLRTYIGRILTGLIYLALAWVVVRLIDVVSAKLLATMTGRQLVSVSSVMPLGKRTLKAAAVVIAILASLGSWGYDTTALLAGLGVGGLAIALAAQKTIENLFGGVAITTDRPVLVGDFCKFGDKSGVVEDIGLRSTRIRTLDRTVVTVPNGQFSSLQLENFGRRDKIWFHPVLTLRRDTTTEQMRAVLSKVRELLSGHPKIESPGSRARFIGVGPDSLNVEIFSYVATADYDEFLVIQEELLLRILEIVEEAGTALALPTQLNLVSRPSKTPPRVAESLVKASGQSDGLG